MTYSAATPAEVRALIRTGQLTAPTTGYCDGYAQGNLVVLPKALAWDFLLFCQRNPKACPLLEVTDAGQRSFSQFAPDSDIARDIPRYRIYRNGELAEETTDVTHYFEERNDLVSFLIGCSFSFESALLEADIPVRQIEEGVNVPMYNTNIPAHRRGCSAAIWWSACGLSHMPRCPQRWPSRRACPASTARQFKLVRPKPSASPTWLTRTMVTPSPSAPERRRCSGPAESRPRQWSCTPNRRFASPMRRDICLSPMSKIPR